MPDPSAQPVTPSTPDATGSIDDRAQTPLREPSATESSGTGPEGDTPRKPPPKSVVWLTMIASAVLVVALSLMVGLALTGVISGGNAQPGTRGFEIVFLSFQAAVVVFTVLAARLYGPLPDTLALRRSTGDKRTVGWVLLAMVAVWLIGLFVSLTFFRELLLQDIATYRDAFTSPDLTVRLAILFSTVIGAPVSEELLFRGFLLGGLMTAGCPVIAAVLVSNTIWTLLHLGYSVLGLIDVFIAGLFLSALFAVTRSVWWPIIVHAVFNTAAIGVMFAVAV